MAELQVQDITKTFGDTQVLKGISLDVADGEFVSLVGPSGCGKSTLLRIIAGLETQTGGEILIGGRSVAGVRAADRNLSMVFQSYALYPHLSVGENIAVPLKMRQMTAWQRLPLVGGLMPGARATRQKIGAAVQSAAKTLEIDQLLARKPGQLSGGQRQRVALGRALVREPAAFLLDEPLSNLDAKLRVQTRAEIAELHRRLGATFVYVTHDQVEAMTMSSRIAVMMGGEILQCAAPAEVYDNPSDIRVAEFIGSPKINILPGEIEGGVLSLLDRPVAQIGVEARQSLSLGLRPEALVLDDSAPLLTGIVAHAENLGSEIFAHVEVPGLEARLVVRIAPQDRARAALGASLGLRFALDQVLIFASNGARLRPKMSPAPAAEVA